MGAAGSPLTLENYRIPKRSGCEQFPPILGICSGFSNRRYYVHEHHNIFDCAAERNTVNSRGLIDEGGKFSSDLVRDTLT
jgi:hypothetical protein